MGTVPPPARVPPHDLAAEDSLLGAALLSSDALAVLATKVTPDDFYKPANAHVAAALTRCYVDEIPADPVTVADLLRRSGLLDEAGGTVRLVTLQSATPSTSSAARYAAIVHDHATLRRLLGAAAAVEAHVYEGHTDDAHAAVLRAQELVAGVASLNGTRAYSTLDFGDVAALLAGDVPVVEPEFLVRSDGQALFYAGRMNVIQGEPTGGKSWLALEAARMVLELGGAVLYIDYEDSLAGIVGRLLALGADPAAVAERFVYVRQDGPFGATERVELGARLRDLNPDLVVIDGVAEALSREGLSEDRATEVVAWIERLPRWLARTGAAVVLLDHVAKDKETRGRWARGSSAKLAAIDGAAYEVVVKIPFSRKRAGRIDLRVAKDRPGGVGAVGEIAATVIVTPHADGARVVLDIGPEQAPASKADPWRPTIYMRKVSDELERANGPLTARAMIDLVGARGKEQRAHAQEAIARLLAEGWIVEARSGPSKYLRLVTPFREEIADPPLPPPPPDALFDVDEETGSPELEPDNVVRGPWRSPWQGPGPPPPDHPDHDPDRDF